MRKIVFEKEIKSLSDLADLQTIINDSLSQDSERIYVTAVVVNE